MTNLILAKPNTTDILSNANPSQSNGQLWTIYIAIIRTNITAAAKKVGPNADIIGGKKCC